MATDSRYRGRFPFPQAAVGLASRLCSAGIQRSKEIAEGSQDVTQETTISHTTAEASPVENATILTDFRTAKMQPRGCTTPSEDLNFVESVIRMECLIEDRYDAITDELQEDEDLDESSPGPLKKAEIPTKDEDSAGTEPPKTLNREHKDEKTKREVERERAEVEREEVLQAMEADGTIAYFKQLTSGDRRFIHKVVKGEGGWTPQRSDWAGLVDELDLVTWQKRAPKSKRAPRLIRTLKGVVERVAGGKTRRKGQ
ncbi:unnamed protein product [Vitrella brassicaformis CCMP3155]|uniref:Uncharacterized protein n=1 Tax=Vitrella brassicaformis (strain CCMP3155) TaxID=1169540 RepID=A0A0G4EP28_VITBC|nr:unnamed protein product [Vitrella brassicaformis CCMP3155]|eukprot:CEL99179.1 unnamed protein product [Vitrella brassicaformis CCMP3155]